MIDAKKFARVAAAARIKDVHLVEATAKTRVRSTDDVPDNASVSIAHGARVKEVPDKKGHFFVLAMFDVRVRAENEAKAEPFVAIKAVFELAYRLPEDFKTTRLELQLFAETNAVFNAWPYAREFVQTMTARMNLPPIVLPLFRASNAGKPAEETERKPADKNAPSQGAMQ